VASRGRRDPGDDPLTRRLRGVSLDVTDRRRAEAEARQGRDAVARLGRVALANELSGSLAHELNQPLGAILSNAQAARRMLDHEQVNRDEIRDILDDIIADDRHAADVMERVRSLVRKAEPRLETLDITDVIRDGLRLVRRDLHDRGITPEIELADGLPPVRGDRTQLLQVLLNLVVNAMDAMADPHRTPRRLLIRTLRDGDGVCMAVADTGPGIPADMLEQIFESFVTTKPQGMGMGLAVCRGIVAAHGGSIRAENNPDGGATLCVHLPAATGEAG
jgi:C4-dicarboxylate-specific signal transduction histidine kinase